MANAQLSFHGYREAVKFFVDVQGLYEIEMTLFCMRDFYDTDITQRLVSLVK